MARYTGPAYKQARRLNFSLLENGKETAKRPYAPGQHGVDRRHKLSEYGVQLQEKQKDNPGSDTFIRNEYYDCIDLFPFHIGTFLFGNGAPHSASSYGKREDNLKDTRGFHRSDTALPGYYLNYGIISLVMILILLFKVVIHKIPDEYYYCKLYIFSNSSPCNLLKA